jgi:hypothetical protein
MHITIYMDDTPLAEVLKSNDAASEPTMRQRFSRARKQAVAERDALFSFLLIDESEFAMEGKLPRFHWVDKKNRVRLLKWSELYGELAKISVQPGAWADGRVPGGRNVFAIRPLNTGLRRAPAHLYLVVTQHEYQHTMNWFPEVRYYNGFAMGGCLEYIHQVINPTGKPQRNRFMYRMLEAYPTELPGLNKALADVPDDYYAWLISNSLPRISYYS